MSRIAIKKGYWIGGTATAGLGVALVKLLAPALAGPAGTAALAAGYALALAGLATIVAATRQPINESGRP